ncbi:MAG: IPT/TIG domain-containing protein [Actinobacteria bacterium]|nr:IPT/TIG domain-containing protein [Actinomycetota bacterium]
MVGETSLSRMLALTFVAALALFVTAAAGLLPVLPAAPALADPGPGWESQGPVPGVTTLYAIDAVDADVAWTVGPDMIAKTVNGGAEWVVQATADGTILEDVDAVDADTAWTVGAISNISLVVSTADGGTTWVPHDTTAFRTSIPFPYSTFLSFDRATAVTALDANTAWVAVRYFGMIPNPLDPYHPTELPASGIWKTVDGGASWTLQYFGATSKIIYSIEALDAQTIWAGAGFPQAQAFRSENGGASWATQEVGTYGALTSLAVVDSNVAIGATGTQLAKTFDAGQTWTVVDDNLADATLFRMAAADADVAWAIGTSTGSIATLIAKTTDGGQTWTTQSTGAANYVFGLTALDPCAAWAVGNYGNVLKTVDGGDALPDIVSVVPTSGAEGAAVTVSGCDFGDTQDSSYVSFGDTQATTYTSWSHSEIVAAVPAGVAGEVAVTVTTAEGTSNPKGFTITDPLSLTSITPDTAVQNAITVEITDLAGTGFQPGATVRLEQGDTVLAAYDVSVVSGESITCKIGFFLAPTGAWDVVVENPDGAEARLTGGFTVTSACGEGGGAALLMLGLTLGLLSLAGSTRLRRRRK